MVHVPFNLGWSVLDFQLKVVFASCVHCHLFGSGTSLLYAVFCFALLIFFSTSWLTFWHCPGGPKFCVKSYTTYPLSSRWPFVTPFFWLCLCIVFLGLDVLFFAHIDAILKSYYDLEFLCRGGYMFIYIRQEYWEVYCPVIKLMELWVNPKGFCI